MEGRFCAVFGILIESFCWIFLFFSRFVGEEPFVLIKGYGTILWSPELRLFIEVIILTIIYCSSGGPTSIGKKHTDYPKFIKWPDGEVQHMASVACCYGEISRLLTVTSVAANVYFASNAGAKSLKNFAWFLKGILPISRKNLDAPNCQISITYSVVGTRTNYQNRKCSHHNIYGWAFSGRIAVKLINHLGGEVMKVFRVNLWGFGPAWHLHFLLP